MYKMLELHMSKEGPVLMLLMEDSHLINTVRLKLTRLQSLRKMANVKMDRHTTILFGMRNLDEEDVAQKTRQEVQNLYPYLATMFYRGLMNDEIMELLHEIVPDPRGGNMISLPLSNEDCDF